MNMSTKFVAACSLFLLGNSASASQVICRGENIDSKLLVYIKAACDVSNSAKAVKFASLKETDIPKITIIVDGKNKSIALYYNFSLNGHKLATADPGRGFLRDVGSFPIFVSRFRDEFANTAQRAGDGREQQLVELPLEVVLVDQLKHDALVFSISGGEYMGRVNYVSPVDQYSYHDVGSARGIMVFISSNYIDIQGKQLPARRAIEFLGLKP